MTVTLTGAAVNDTHELVNSGFTVEPVRSGGGSRIIRYTVSWDEDTRLVTIKGKNLKTGDDVIILINIASDVAYVNGAEVRLDSPAFIENNRTYTPVRFIAEELGADVEWFETDKKAVITKPIE